MFRKSSFVLFMVVFSVLAMSVVYASSTLEGEAQIISGATVYVAEVLPEQNYTDVFGVKGANTNYSSHGLVKIDRGTVTTVYGARGIGNSNPVYASYNQVDISNSTIGTVYGGYAYGGNGNAGVQNNSVKINGGNITGYIYGGNADGTTLSVTGNSVDVKDATVGKSVYGAIAYNTSSWLSLLRNTVTVENSNINGSVYGGYASGSSTASNNNTVVIKGNSTVRGLVCGGYALSDHSDSKNNTVIIEGGILKNHIYGGIGRNASGNTIVVKGGDLSAAYLYGYSDGRKSHSNNTLELWTSDVSVKSACNFENYYFIVPENVAGTSKFMLKTQTPVNLSESKIAVALQNGAVLKVGDRINLIDKTEGEPILSSLEGIDLKGGSLKGGTLLTSYDFNLDLTEGALAVVATSTGKTLLFRSSIDEPAGEAIPEAQALLGSQIASAALVSETADLVSGAALSEAKAVLHSAEQEKMVLFLSTGGGADDYYTSAHLHMNAIEVVGGIARKISGNVTDGLIGAFIENGNGKYSSFNGFESGSVLGQGSSHHYGAGVLLSIEPSEKKGLYFQAAGHAGGIKNNWSSSDFKEEISYSSGNFYCGSAVDAGYIIQAAKTLSCDVFGKFLWTYQKGDTTDVNGENVEFAALNFIKTRLGTRVTFDGNSNFNAYCGLAWEREYNKKAKAKVNSYNVEVSGLLGNSLFFELGTSFKNDNWQFNLAASGYSGVRRGFNGSAVFTISF